MNEDIVIPLAFFATVIITAIGIPLVRAFAKNWERLAAAPPAPDFGRLEDRLSRIEQSIDAMAIEVERISEGQRFTTRLLAGQQRQDPTGAVLSAGSTNGVPVPARARGATVATEDGA